MSAIILYFCNEKIARNYNNGLYCIVEFTYAHFLCSPFWTITNYNQFFKYYTFFIKIVNQYNFQLTTNFRKIVAYLIKNVNTL